MKILLRRSPVKLFIGFIFADERIYSAAKSVLKNKFGPIDFESQLLPFNHTNYYEKELGANLKRKFISFASLIQEERLAKIKVITKRIEMRFCFQDKRKINIDPGIVTLNKVILATTKDYKHRIYLCKGIHAEVTLFYQKRAFRPWEWTYPDYKTSEYINIFNNIREIYSHQISHSQCNPLI